MFPYLPGGLDDFCARVVPELQRRGLFRREYEGKTLRENLGLPRPTNRFFETRKAAEWKQKRRQGYRHSHCEEQSDEALQKRRT